MVKSYCVKQKKQTQCIPGSEKYVKIKNGCTMMKCKCSERVSKSRSLFKQKGITSCF